MHSTDSYLVDSLPIHINGNEKFATGLTKRTTIDDVKYAILSCSLNCTSEALNLNDYAIFERWQGNERILDGNIKIYKLIRLWKSLPGNQLDNVKFIIKKRKNIQNLIKQIHNTASPSMSKTWNSNKAANALRQSSIRSQRDTIVPSGTSSSSSSSVSRDNSIDSTSNDDEQKNNYDKRYSSIRKFNRSKKSNICKNTEDRRETFLNLVAKQNEILEKQHYKMEHNDKLIKKCVQNCLKTIRSVSSKSIRSKSLDKFDQQEKIINNENPPTTTINKSKTKRLASKTRDRSSSIRRLIVKDDQTTIRQQKDNEITTNDIKQTFENVLDDKQLEEYASLCNNYFKMQKNLNINKHKIDKLNTELYSIQQQEETSQKIQTSLQTYDKQNEKLTHLNDALNRIDDIILLKSNLIKSLESELKKIEDEQLFDLKTTTKTTTSAIVDEMKNKKTLSNSTSTSSTISSYSSASSILTSVSEQGIMYNNNGHVSKIIKTTHFGDNDSDTGISSANSDDFGSQLETLV